MLKRFTVLLLSGAFTSAHATASTQPEIGIRSKAVISVDGRRFKDLNANGTLDPYEDWRLTAATRAADLAGRMTLAEKVGMMLIATNNPACDGSLSEAGKALIEKQKMTRFILRAKIATTPPDCSKPLAGVAARAGYPLMPEQMANFTNAVQARLEATRLGIPALFKDNARNHVEPFPTFGIAVGAGALTEFPKEAGLAAAALGAGAPVDIKGTIPAGIRPDLSIISGFTRVMGREWRAIGLRGMYGYMADLGTEPRWSRFHETFTEDADLMSDIVGALIDGLQGPVQTDGTSLSPASSVALTIKHFPGGGPQEFGLDPHYTFGKRQIYPNRSGQYGFAYHLKPFQIAIRHGASSIMPYYGVPIGITHDGVRYDEIGMAFSRQIVTGLLREKLGFKGYVNSDSGIIEQRGWGLESYRTNPETGKPYTSTDRIVVAVRAGTDILSEFSNAEEIIGLVRSGRLDEAKDIDPAVRRLLVEQFQLGLFENPYVDASAAPDGIGRPEDKALGLSTQQRSIVLLKNTGALLPLRSGANVYVMGFDAAAAREAGFAVTDGNVATRPAVPKETDALLVKILISNSGARAYSSLDPKMGGRKIPSTLATIDPQTGKSQRRWADQDPCVYEANGSGRPKKSPDHCLDNGLIFGGGFPWETNLVTLSEIARAKSLSISPALGDIQKAMREIGDPAKVVVSIYFRNPYVLDEKSGVRDAAALLATFGVSDKAQLDIISGRVAPQGRLPFALPATREAVLSQDSDAPGYGETRDGALFPFGFGLGTKP